MVLCGYWWLLVVPGDSLWCLVVLGGFGGLGGSGLFLVVLGGS